MNRRDLLGRVLGFYAGTAVPWIGRRPGAPPIPQPDVLPGYRTALRLDDGRLLQGPGVAAIGDGLIRFAPVEARRHLVVAGCKLSYQGVLLADLDLPRAMALSPPERLEIALGVSWYRARDPLPGGPGPFDVEICMEFGAG